MYIMTLTFYNIILYVHNIYMDMENKCVLYCVLIQDMAGAIAGIVSVIRSTPVNCVTVT